MDTFAPRRRFFTKKSYLFATILLLLASATGFGYYRYCRPVGLPTVEHVLQIENDTSSPDIPWPLANASIGTVENGILASKPGQTPQPTASTAKLITVLTVLKEKPLALDEQGPLLTMNLRDEALYNNYYAKSGSVVAIRAGEQLSEYQMLQGILIRSGNNLADGLALWAFGNMGAYQKAAQALVEELGMTSTTVGPDASGYSPATTSTAEDLTRLGIAAMKNDVVREIVGQTASSFPVDGTKPNTNWSLGQNGIIGIKTGNTPQAGGVFVIASEYAPENETPITIVATVQGAGSTNDAIIEAGELVEAIKPLFIHKTIVRKGTVVATISTPWGENSDVVTDEDMTTFGWKYSEADTPKITLDSKVPFEKNAILGILSVGTTSGNLIASDPINQPSWQWRITTRR